MDINFEHYKIFYYVGKYGNMTKAAAALNSSQPNVTRIIKLLETQLNCSLIIREPRGIRLTEAGRRLYAHVEIACRHLTDAQEELCGQSPPDGGTVEIGATESALHIFLLDALRSFKVQYPAVRIKIHNHPTPEILKQLFDGRLDLAVATSPFEAPKNARCEKLLEFREILVGGPQYKSLEAAPFKLEDMKKYPWVGLGRGTVTYQFYKQLFLDYQLDMEPDMEVAAFNLLLLLILHNFGIGFVPEKLALPLIKERKLVCAPGGCAIPQRAIQLVSDRRRRKSPAADTLYHYIQQQYLAAPHPDFSCIYRPDTL